MKLGGDEMWLGRTSHVMLALAANGLCGGLEFVALCANRTAERIVSVRGHPEAHREGNGIFSSLDTRQFILR